MSRPLGDQIGLEHEAAAVLAVEQGSEDTRRVEMRQTQPIDRTIPGHECDGAAVAYGGIVTDLCVTVDALPDHRGNMAFAQ